MLDGCKKEVKQSIQFKPQTPMKPKMTRNKLLGSPVRIR